MYPSYSPLFTLGLLADPSRPTVDDDASALYFALKAGERDTAELRSFLYLDLADSRRPAPSHKRKHSTLSKSTSWTCSPDANSVYDFTRTEKRSLLVPARRRTSKESLRTLPSPKPAPSATLPPTPPPSFKKRSASSVIASPLSPTPRLRRPASLRSESISSHDRRKSRMDALACLEGRSRAPNRIPRTSRLRNNFMSFSDDEDERSMVRRSTASTTPVIQTEDLSAFADVEDEADAIIPTLARRREATAKPAQPARPARKRRGTIDSWFPLKSFIDLKDDDMSWNWRSFVEIGGVA